MTEDWRDFWFDAYELKRDRELEQEEHERDVKIERLYEKGEMLKSRHAFKTKQPKRKDSHA